MTQTTQNLWRARFEQIVLALILSLLAATLANFAIAVFLDVFSLVSYPYNPDGLIVGIAIMSVVGIVAVLSRKPLLTGILSSILLGAAYGTMAWNADRFVEFLPLTALVTLMPLLTAGIAGLSAHFLMRRVKTSSRV